jgi:hypothetical protein
VSPLELGIIGFAALLSLIALRVPIAVAMMAVGLVGYSLLNGLAPLLAYLKTATFWTYHVRRSCFRHASWRQQGSRSQIGPANRCRR